MTKTAKLLKSEGVILVPIRPDSFAVYKAAAELLRERIGQDAPDTMTIINYELTNREAEGIASDYYDYYDHERDRLIFNIHMKPGQPDRPPTSEQIRTAKIVAIMAKGRSAVNRRAPDTARLRRRMPTRPADPCRN